MNILSDSVLVGSKYTCGNRILPLNHDHATAILGKVKSLCCPAWWESGLATTDPAEFHKALTDTVRSVVKVKSHRFYPVVAAGGFAVEVLTSEGKAVSSDTDAIGEAV
jgi:hypothetical protein